MVHKPERRHAPHLLIFMLKLIVIKSVLPGLYVESHGVVHNVNYNKSESNVVVGSFYTTLAVNDWWDNAYEPIWITASSQVQFASLAINLYNKSICA